jgi:hypothetical protein
MRHAAAVALTIVVTVSIAHGGNDPYSEVRGMTVSCHGAGRVWGTDGMVRTMEELRDLGVNWITIHPYAGIREDGTVGGTLMSAMYRDPSWLTRPIAEAHRLGLKLMIKPHLAYWGTDFTWRGDIEFETAEQWNRFFETYDRWITLVAEICKDADAFVVGTELDRTVHHESRWREIIRGVREKTRAPLTYSAGWDEYENVVFWDALDAIAIQGYFPLVDHEGVPSQQELDRAWRAIIGRLEDFGRRHNRTIILGELGYNLSRHAALRPWEYAQGGEDAEEIQRRCLTAALGAIDESDVVAGAFLWKWFPGEDGRRRGNFLESTPAMREIIASHWRDRDSSGLPED